MKTIFNVDFRTEFGLACAVKKCDTGDTMEQTFKNALNSLNKLQTKTWECISFPFGDEAVTVMEHHFTETNFDFEQSAQVEPMFVKYGT